MRWYIFFFFSLIIASETNCLEDTSQSDINSKNFAIFLELGFIRACQLKHESGNTRGTVNKDGTCTSTWMYHGMRFLGKQHGENSSFEVWLYEPMTNYVYRPVVPEHFLHETTEENVKILDECKNIIKNVQKALKGDLEIFSEKNIQCHFLNEECSRFGCLSRFKCHIN